MESSSFAFRAEKCNSDLFSKYFPGAQLKFSDARGEYIADFLDIKYLEGLFYKHLINPGQELDALVLVAQTGKGKNYWVLRVLRVYAMQRKQKVLYLCNRTALSRQQIKETAETVDPTRVSSCAEVVDVYRTGNITLMTYHRFYKLLKENGIDYFKSYSYCIVDEAHFFCQDCLFNADTEQILRSIPEVFRGKFRIYMTATPDYVYDLIYWAEWNAIASGGMAPANCSAQVVLGKGLFEDSQKSLPILPVIKFKYDYSAYQNLCFFENKTRILEEIKADVSNAKWIVFVNSKAVGRELEKALKEEGMESLYIDSDSRASSDIEDRQKWEYLQEKGNLGKYRVLISTSVLDNGFSIKDRDVGNIVLFTEDKTEFLQELGRVRLEPQQKIKLYISKMNAKSRIHPNNWRRILDIFSVYYGSSNIEECGYPAAEIMADKVRAMAMADKYQLGFVGKERVVINGEPMVKPYINNFARYVARLLQQESNEYQQLVTEKQEEAHILYKKQWLKGLEEVEVLDIEVPTGVRAAEKVEKLLSEYENRRLNEESDLFNRFAKEFKALYITLLPKDKSINSGRNRKEWQKAAINSHLKKLADAWEEVALYELVERERGECMLVRVDS